eukprot:scaffold188899_cov11-Tisochrysis_lutea.AAC.1
MMCSTRPAATSCKRGEALLEVTPNSARRSAHDRGQLCIETPIRLLSNASKPGQVSDAYKAFQKCEQAGT